MQESWNTILERAARNLSIELAERPVASPAIPSVRRRRFPGRAPGPLTFAETREMLARELEGIPHESMGAVPPKILKDIKGKRGARSRPAGQASGSIHPGLIPPQPPVRESRTTALGPLILSVSAVALSLYGIYFFLH
jgi:hypothetical protein